MRILFSTAGQEPKNSFRRWREMIFERLVPVELTPTSDQTFHGTLEAADIGPLQITRITQSAISTEATWDTIRRHGKRDTLSVALALRGEIFIAQDDRTSTQHAGDLVVLDRRPTIIEAYADNRALLIEVPRERLENVLGSTRRYTALTVGAAQASTSLAATFLNELVRTHDRLPSDTAARMASIGVDLIIASIAERLAQDTPRTLQGTLIVQRAAAYIEANLGDTSLDPAKLASAVGVSLRYLQQLFQAHERNIADWIWQRRLEVAAERLADPGSAHLSIGALAYGCGFINQAHFSRRFRDRYGLTPGEHRWRAFNAAKVA